MKKIFTTVLLILCLYTYAQKGKYKPFKLIVLEPDTAIIDQTLFSDTASVQADYQTRYYNSIRQMEDLLKFKDYTEENEQKYKEIQENLIKDIPLAKAREAEVKRFKYFQTLSAYSTEVYQFYFNEYEPFSTILEFPNQKTDISSISRLADTSKADFIIFFSNIHTEINDGWLILKLTTSLFSKKENQIILRKETEGDITSRGFIWTCKTPLSCLLINGIRTATDEIVPIIAKRQKRQ